MTEQGRCKAGHAQAHCAVPLLASSGGKWEMYSMCLEQLHKLFSAFADSAQIPFFTDTQCKGKALKKAFLSRPSQNGLCILLGASVRAEMAKAQSLSWGEVASASFPSTKTISAVWMVGMSSWNFRLREHVCGSS